MPYKHPVLGVECMTVPEFWAAEGARENKDPADLKDEFYGEIEKDMERERQAIIADLPGALSKLKEYYSPEYGDSDFQPLEVLEITDPVCSYNFRSSTSGFTAKVKCSDNKERVLQFVETSYSGSYMDPPDYDVDCKVISE